MDADLAKKLNVKQEHTLHVQRSQCEALPDTGTPDADVVVDFVHMRADLEHAAPALQAAREDRIAWIAYPKGGKLGTDLNRDILWDALKDAGIRAVRQVSIDDTWSALRFRPA